MAPAEPHGMNGDTQEAPRPPGPLSQDDAIHLARRFRLLAEPGRIRMIHALLGVGEMCVSDLAATVGSSESATSHQLRRLRQAGLVRGHKHGRTVRYRIADGHVRLLLETAMEHHFHDSETS